jgi:hypothetical protein
LILWTHENICLIFSDRGAFLNRFFIYKNKNKNYKRKFIL